jgi:hypothetical protein
MLATVFAPILGHESWCDAGGGNLKLYLAAALERDGPERIIIDTVPARRQQAVVLAQYGPVAAECVSH